MQHPDFGELTPARGESGWFATRRFGHLARFIETDRELEYVDGSELDPDFEALLDKSPEQIQTDGVPEKLQGTPLGFMLENQDALEQFQEQFRQLAEQHGMAMPDFDALAETTDWDDEDEQDDDCDDDGPQARPEQGIFPVHVMTDGDGDAPTPAQVAAFRNFLAREDELSAAVINAVYEYYRHLQEDQPGFFDIKVDSPDDQIGVIEFTGMIVRREELDGEALLGFSFHAEWEIEHGLSVLLHQGEVVDVGDWETAHSGPMGQYSVWHSLVPRDRQLHIDRLTQVLQEAWQAQEERDLQDPYHQMLQAYHAEDWDRIRELQAAGLDLNLADERHHPPLFVAVESMDTEKVRRLLELGADPLAVDAEGRTVLSAAEEALKNFRFSQDLLNSELSQSLFESLGQLAQQPDPAGPSPMESANQYAAQMEEILQLLKSAAAAG